ncbi:FtsK/SpoIIIE domain-containing protein [Streptomyces sp. NPDC050400]|uniref:FtsK/SpoIIIE domain-containing protein n=1 Tax=Streptomyces sp. NPDC050400 TaxID=3365610 RepID=UPI00379E9540
MGRIFTVIAPDGAERDVVVEAAGDTPVRAVVAALGRLCGLDDVAYFSVRGPGPSAVLEPHDGPLDESPLRDGCRVWLGRPAPSAKSPAPDFTALPPELLTPGSDGCMMFRRPPRTRATELPAVTVPPVRVRAARSGRSLRWFRSRWDDAVRTAAEILRPWPAELMNGAFGESARLWERRTGDKDHLLLRLGSTGAVGTPVPVALDLPATGVLGVAGPTQPARRLCAWLVAQVALLHSPADVGLRVLTSPSGAPDWRFARWLPGVRAHDGAGLPRISCDNVGHHRQIAEALATLRDRQQRGPVRYADGVRRSLVLVLDGARSLTSLPGVSQLLREGPASGVYVICLGPDSRSLPPECAAVVQVEQFALRTAAGSPAGTRFTLTRRARADVTGLADQVSDRWLDEMARAVAPLRDAAAEELRPQPHRLLDLLGLGTPDSREIAARWGASPRGTEVLIGRSTPTPVALDLLRDGPHALVAGTTGSGKTEFLCTWIASLAVANRPDEMTFMLVDHKGGAAFRGLVRLPHTVAVVNDVGAGLGDRVLHGLGAELRRRERRLFEAHTKDIAEYAELRSQEPEGTEDVLRPLPRLVIVIDEFASLAAEEPGFLQGLVEIARRGRSLGVHLVYATQRPAGVVGPEIRALTNLRIALRLMDTGESLDVIDAPDAAHLSASSPGLALIRTGTSDPLLVQSARVGAPHRPVGRETVDVDDVVPYGTQRRAPLKLHAEPDSVGTTDLELLVDALCEATSLLAIPAPHTPLPPPLKEVLSLTDIQPPGRGRDLAPLAFGLEDAPEEQTQRPAILDLARDGNLRIVGAPRTGRSQFLRTLAAAAARQHGTADVHVYGIDCGDGALQALTELPHCGAVVNLGRPDHMVRLLGMLTATVRRRQEVLSHGGFAGIGAQRQAVAGPRRMHYLLVLLDGWEEFLTSMGSTDGGRAVEDLYAVLRGGPQVGVCTVLAGGPQILSTRRLVSLTERLLVLRLPDPDGYASLGLTHQRIPQVQPAGRALSAESGRLLQIATLPGPTTRQGQTDALARYAAEARQRETTQGQGSQRPFRIEDLPLVADQFHVGTGKGRPVGREAELAWLRDRHATGASVALLGPRRAGKTWVLEELWRRLRADGATAVRPIVVLPSSGRIDTPDALARLLDRRLSGPGAAQRLIDKVRKRSGSDRMAFLLDEIGRLVNYDPGVVSWLRDLGQAGAWLVYTGTEKDWHQVVHWALTAPGSSFGNDVNARVLGPLDDKSALKFLTGTAENLGVNIAPDRTGRAVLGLVGTWPFYLQVVGDAVVRAAQANEVRPLTDDRALAELVEQRLLVEWDHHFRARWAEIGRAGRAALLADPGRLPVDAARAQRNDLREVGLLRHGDTWLSDRPFFDWIGHSESSLRDGESRP